MLKKIVHINLKLVGIILLLLIAAQIITAYFFGIMAENQFKSQFDKLTDKTLEHGKELSNKELQKA